MSAILARTPGSCHSQYVATGKNIEIEVSRIASGGDGIGVDAEGRVVFIPGALPGDTVQASLVTEKKRFATARLLRVIRAADGRREPPCSHVIEGCGGCDWQHAIEPLQSELRVKIVSDSLQRIGRLDAELVQRVVRAGPSLEAAGYRTTVRALVSNGRAGFRKASSHDPIVVDSCLIAHPLVEQVLIDGRFGDASEVTIRAGANTGERLAIVTPTAKGVVVPPDVLVVGADELRAGRSVHFHEEVAGVTFRVSAQSFFQCRPDGAGLLARLAADAASGVDGPLLDAYCGVGLFGALCGGGRAVTGVEASPHAIADALINLGPDATLVESKFANWKPANFGVVIADPARIGLGSVDAAVLAETEAEVVVLVSCDPASLGRDAGLLQTHGYELQRVDVVDLFGQTSHIECVSSFSKL